MPDAGGIGLSHQFQQPHTVRLDRRHLLTVLQVEFIGAILVLIAAGIHESPGLIRAIWFLSGGLGIVTIIFLSRSAHLDWLSAPIVYAGVFWLFHFGLVFPAAIAPTILDEFPYWQRDWLDAPEAQFAVLLSLLFLTCFALGVYVVRSRVTPGDAASPDVTVAPELVRGGRVSIVLGLSLAALALVRLGVTIFLQPYNVYYGVHNNFSWSIWIVAFGLTVQAAGGRPIRSILKTAGFCYLPIAVLSMLGGARVAPLFSAAVLGVVLAKRGLRVPRLRLLVAAICVLALISIVKEVRQTGWSEFAQSGTIEEAVTLTGGLTEMGGSLKPVYAVVHSIRVRGEDYFYGETYIYPFYRQFQRLAGMERGTKYTDRRFVAMYTSFSYGSIGFSTVAEAFFNGGILGVVVFALAWGVILGILDQRASSPYGLAILSAVMIPMMTNIRNSFIYVPAWIFLGMMAIGICRYFLLVPRERDSIAASTYRAGRA